MCVDLRHFYTSDLSTQDFGVHRRSRNQVPTGTKGQLSFGGAKVLRRFSTARGPGPLTRSARGSPLIREDWIVWHRAGHLQQNLQVRVAARG